MTVHAEPARTPNWFQVATLSEPDELHEVEQLYREVFTSYPTDSSINPRLLFALAHHGGIVVGARAASGLIGFAFSFLARDAPDAELYQYSQTAGVAELWRGRGVGRALKLAQRDTALATGIGLLRWRYDPMQAANAHFNLDVLGGVGTVLDRDAYGVHGPPADGGEPTDRMLIEWRLGSARVSERAGGRAACATPPPPTLRAAELVEGPDHVLLGLPADWRSVRSNPAYATVRARVIGQMTELLADGFVAVSCTRLDAETAVYRFERAEQVLEPGT